MRNKTKFHSQGLTLLEVLMVMVIISAFILFGVNYINQRTQEIRIDRTVSQMQQVLNAALSYYVDNGTWPCITNTLPAPLCISDGTPYELTVLQAGGKYLPATGFVSPWNGVTYKMSVPVTKSLFSVSVTLPTMANQWAIATYIAGKLPLAKIDATCLPPPAAPAATCSVTAYVGIPAQSLNNASAVNFSGLYHHGGCVPVPTCPVDNKTGTAMTPQIFVIPVSVSGVNDTGSNNVYPLTSFTAYAVGGTNTTPALCKDASSIGGDDCTDINGTSDVGVTKYWRACLQVVTSLGDVSTTRTDVAAASLWGQSVTLAAYTRCGISGEPAGSTFSVFGN